MQEHDFDYIYSLCNLACLNTTKIRALFGDFKYFEHLVLCQSDQDKSMVLMILSILSNLSCVKVTKTRAWFHDF
jgi:hypothetical protein